ncbi:hypothetical protein FRC07_011412, partial [Ceratobasidium sp. 392]
MGASINGEFGIVFTVGEHDFTEDSVAPELLQWTKELFGPGPRRFTRDEETALYTASNVGGDGLDVIRKGTIVKR